MGISASANNHGIDVRTSNDFQEQLDEFKEPSLLSPPPPS